MQLQLSETINIHLAKITNLSISGKRHKNATLVIMKNKTLTFKGVSKITMRLLTISSQFLASDKNI